ncbi:PIN domain-containing protein [Thermomonospora umbrina]|uniref:PIN domain-containing protein n=1 Tax=Thermomonospora umbrina TaxID=111806 RepID=A0A3D9STD1_9ACTN|nr:PIN domain-containing protein [Thermomonospora umbrina]REE97263.1 hypothetical protein DFJ69_2728 [Thermomonospora umbrina]
MTEPSRLPTGLSGRVLDTPAIIDLATGRTRYMRAVAYMAVLNGDTLAVPAAALAQAAGMVPAGGDRDHLTRAIMGEVVIVIPMTPRDAVDIGELGAKHRLGVAAAHVAHTASTRRWPILTRNEDAHIWRDLGFNVDVLP